MKTEDNGLAATAYGPNIVETDINGQKVKINVDTDYPFDGTISFKINLKDGLKFPIYLRIPNWADSSLISFKQENYYPPKGSYYKIEETWNDGDIITLKIPMDLRLETRYNKSVSVLRGPLYFALKIKSEYNSIKLQTRFKGSAFTQISPEHPATKDWEIFPVSDWRYALELGTDFNIKKYDIHRNILSKYPFASQHELIYSEKENKYVEYEDKAPIEIKVHGSIVDEWGMFKNSAAAPPLSPIKSKNEITEITLIPYGSTRIRIAEFPWFLPGSK